MKASRMVIQKVLVTEKGTRLAEAENQYLFNVNPEANKIEIRQAVQDLFKVHVVNVNTLTRKGKMKRDRRFKTGRRSDVKRAIVTLKEGEKIELT